MKRQHLAHILRAASQIADDPDVVVIGSQSMNEKSDRVDAVLGEDSMFHVTNGFYAQGVSVSTAAPPEGFRDRMVRWENHSSQPGRGWCLEPHDLAASKLAAWREKDFEFVGALIEVGLIECAVLRDRVEALPVPSTHRRRPLRWISGFDGR